MHNDMLVSLKALGWFGFSRSDKAPSLKQLVSSLSAVTYRHLSIIPKPKSIARPNTLSSRFGLDRFPLHTDNVLLDVPPKYLVFVAPSPREVATLIWDSFTLPAPSRQRAIFLLQGQTQQKYVRLEQPHIASSIVRFNACLMTPQNREAEDAVKLIEVGDGSVSIDWLSYKTVVIDNWRIFHGRDAGRSLDQRKLHRISAWI
ncbi:hypothetical protein [Aquidulcibacter sp.]|uniref:hypothetical protein n=1 Tax=Aquidulcibacter sp. TaxID=2052990 RepID=UPI0025BBD886|nr:hypothetical protein [Aquidulcibacter sp.]MCA3696453.1 hypothetical protein [Aquidulcibacter sp.]